MALRSSLAAAAIAGLVVLAGCSDDQVSIESNTLAGTQRPIVGNRPPKELTVTQGQKLLADISKDPKRLEKLKPEEKRFLQKAAAAKAIRKQQKDEGR